MWAASGKENATAMTQRQHWAKKFLELRVASKTLSARETALDIVLKMVQRYQSNSS